MSQVDTELPVGRARDVGQPGLTIRCATGF